MFDRAKADRDAALNALQGLMDCSHPRGRDCAHHERARAAIAKATNSKGGDRYEAINKEATKYRTALILVDKILKASHYPVYTVFQLINEALKLP